MPRSNSSAELILARAELDNIMFPKKIPAMPVFWEFLYRHLIPKQDWKSIQRCARKTFKDKEWVSQSVSEPVTTISAKDARASEGRDILRIWRDIWHIWIIGLGFLHFSFPVQRFHLLFSTNKSHFLHVFSSHWVKFQSIKCSCITCSWTIPVR